MFAQQCVHERAGESESRSLDRQAVPRQTHGVDRVSVLTDADCGQTRDADRHVILCLYGQTRGVCLEDTGF
jgi:hypothetical protein